MADSGRNSKKSPGDPMLMTASLFNGMIDAVEANKKASGPGRKRATPQDWMKEAGIVKVKNIGSDRRQFEVVGIKDPIFDPTDSGKLPEFKREVSFQVEVPNCEHVSRFAVLIEPVNTGFVGFAVVSGVVQVRVDIVDESHEYADITPGRAGYLTSVEGGSAQILTREGGEGEQWCIVRLGNNSPFNLACVSTSTPTTATATTGTTQTTGTTEEPTTPTTTPTTPTTQEPTTTGTTQEPTTTGTTGTGTTGTGTTTQEGTTTTGTTQEATTTPTTTQEGTTTTPTTTQEGTTTPTTTQEPTTTRTTETTTQEPTTESTTTGTQEPTTETGTTQEPTTQTTTTGEECPAYSCDGECSIELEVVVDVSCVDGSLIVSKATICLPAGSVSESTTGGD